MAMMTAGSAPHRARIAELEAGLGPFEDPAWRAELAVLSDSVQTAARLLARDCQALVALAAQVPRSPGDERGGTPWTSFVREVAVAKKISDQAAHAEVALAQQLLRLHPVLLAALQAGRVPPHRARLLIEECARYSPQIAAVADRLLADRLPSLPPWRIRQEVTQLALRLDPEGAAAREAVATAGRSARVSSLPDAQAEVVLTGPAPLVQRWWDALTDRARALKAAGDPRSLTALRFDLAVHTDPRELTGHDDLATACGIDDPTGDDGDGDHNHDHRDHDATTEDDDQDSGDGGEADRVPDLTTAPEASQAPGADAGPVTDAGSAQPAPVPPGSALGLGVAVRDDARCTRPVQATITVPASTALGLSNEPGWLQGYGWISAPLARRLLAVAELRKACVAPDSGQLLDLADRVERPRPTPTGLRQAVRTMVLTPHLLRPTVTDAQPQHDPSPALESFVHARDRWCDGPTGSQVPARRTDTDHDEAWPTGPTAAWNLASRSPRTHQLKHAGWSAVRDATGTTWTSPAGQVAHTPRFDHPPPPLPPGAVLPDPDALAAHDRAHTHARTPSRDDPGEPDDGLGRATTPGPAPPTERDESTPVRYGWPDDPPF